MADIDTSVYEPLAQTSADRLVTFLHSLLLRAKGIREKSIMKALRLVHTQGRPSRPPSTRRPLHSTPLRRRS